MSLRLGIECDRCGRFYRVAGAENTPPECPSCGTSPGTVDSGWTLEKGCPLCNCRHLYRRKAFNQLAGLTIIVLGAALAVMVSYWFLLAFTLADLLLYRFVPDLGVCYRCGVELASVSGLARLKPFSHPTAEIYTFEGEEASN